MRRGLLTATMLAGLALPVAAQTVTAAATASAPVTPSVAANPPVSIVPDQACPKGGPVSAMALPRVAAALKANEQIVIVAIGSSSTQSWMSSNPAHSYPAVLQAELQKGLPSAHIVVINRGIGGQDAAEEVTRLDADVLAVRPQVVIWQVGANGVLRQTSTDVFKKLVTAGIARLQAAKLDVILMDNQRTPMIIAAPGHLALDQALADMAHDSGVNLFQRGALMDAWNDNGAPYVNFVSSDGLHLNDLGYRCFADALAADMLAGLRKDTTNLRVSALDKARSAASVAP